VIDHDLRRWKQLCGYVLVLTDIPIHRAEKCGRHSLPSRGRCSCCSRSPFPPWRRSWAPPLTAFIEQTGPEPARTRRLGFGVRERPVAFREGAGGRPEGSPRMPRTARIWVCADVARRGRLKTQLPRCPRSAPHQTHCLRHVRPPPRRVRERHVRRPPRERDDLPHPGVPLQAREHARADVATHPSHHHRMSCPLPTVLGLAPTAATGGPQCDVNSDAPLEAPISARSSPSIPAISYAARWRPALPPSATSVARPSSCSAQPSSSA
jgi:hypothetical protein